MRMQQGEQVYNTGVETMAFLPDEAARSGREVSKSARVLYEVLCSHRNWGNGLTRISDATAIAESGLGRSTFFEAKRELAAKGWIEETNGAIKCTKGAFIRQSRIRTAQSEKQPEGVQISDYGVQNPDSLLMNNQPHVNQPHEPVRVAVRLFVQILGAAPAPKDADLIAQTVSDINQWIETLSYWREKGHQVSNVTGMLDNYRRHCQAKARAYVGQSQPATNASVPDLLAEIEREERDNQELEALLHSLPQDEYERMYAEGRRETIKRCPAAWEWAQEKLRATVEWWIKQQLKLKQA